MSSPVHYASRTEVAAPEEFSILRELCHAFGSARDLEEATESVVRWVRGAVGTAAGIRLAVPDSAGRLQVVAAHGRWSDPANRVARRRSVFTNKRPARTSLGDGRCSLILPLVCRGKSVGTLEILAPEVAIDDRWDILEAVASQTAIVFNNLRDRDDFNRQILVLRRTAGFTRKLVKAATPEEAVQTAVTFCAETLDLPVAGWLVFEDKHQKLLAAARGLGGRKLQSLQIRMRTLPRWEKLPSIQQTSLVVQFADCIHVRRAHAIDAGDALLFVGAPRDELPPSLDAVASLLKDVLDHLASIEQKRRNLEIALGRTAHEVRGPLLATRNAIELFLRKDSSSSVDDELLRRCHQELDKLSDYVESLLRWSAGTTSLHRIPTELGSLARAAVEKTALEFADRSIRLNLAHSAVVLADQNHLKGAIGNIVRNGLAYSPPDAEVEVSLERHDDHAALVVRDQGPGVDPAERENVFGPFSRGGSARRGDGGAGLGLFITRKVVEAHGGTVSLDPTGPGATFRVCLPVHDDT